MNKNDLYEFDDLPQDIATDVWCKVYDILGDMDGTDDYLKSCVPKTIKEWVGFGRPYGEI